VKLVVLKVYKWAAMMVVLKVEMMVVLMVYKRAGLMVAS
jgi:hypothetical protein